MPEAKPTWHNQTTLGTVRIVDARESPIAEMIGLHSVSDHARLIAAAPETAAERDRLRALVEEMAIVLLPMAKGYVAQHPVGRNAEMVAEIEVALAKAREAG